MLRRQINIVAIFEIGNFRPEIRKLTVIHETLISIKLDLSRL